MDRHPFYENQYKLTLELRLSPLESIILMPTLGYFGIWRDALFPKDGGAVGRCGSWSRVHPSPSIMSLITQPARVNLNIPAARRFPRAKRRLATSPAGAATRARA